jgi:hypothetical protein
VDNETTPVTESGLYGDRAAVEVGEVLNNGQSEASADVFAVSAVVDLLERAEKTLLLFIADADACVVDFDGEASLVG